MNTVTFTYCPTAVGTLFTAHSSLEEKHAFSAKERDTETGLSYFGARYYSSELSIWLSVDPMSGKYPSLSPYVYCADNPVKLVDPNGEEVWIIGKEWEAAFKSLQQGTNLCLSIENGVVEIVGGEILNDNDQQLYDAINDNSVIAKINTSDEMPNPDGGENFKTTNGHCYGATYDEKTGKATATNYVNVRGLAALEQPGATGAGMMHEVTEAYGIGCVSVKSRRNIAAAFRRPFSIQGPNNTTITGETYGPDYGTYMYCHSNATPAPNEMSLEQSQNYRNPDPQYLLPRNIPKLNFK